MHTLRGTISPILNSGNISRPMAQRLTLAFWQTFIGLESMQNTSSVPSMATAIPLRISSAVSRGVGGR